MHIQKVLGSDIVMIFDECPPVHVDGQPVDKRVIERSMDLSLRWAERSRRAHEGKIAGNWGPRADAITHGAVVPALERQLAELKAQRSKAPKAAPMDMARTGLIMMRCCVCVATLTWFFVQVVALVLLLPGALRAG